MTTSKELPPTRDSVFCPKAFYPAFYEDARLLVLCKPSGMPSVRVPHKNTWTAVDWAIQQDPTLANLKNPITQQLEAGLLHRLDTETSGLLVFAKSKSDWEWYRNAWKQHQIKKLYRAWVQASPALQRLPLEIHTPLAHHDKSKKKMIALLSPSFRHYRGKPLSAETRVIRSHSQTNGAVDLEIQIITGVRHQIRCHLASIQAPLIGDRIYKGPPSTRLWLHAIQLELPRPEGDTLTLTADLPPDWSSGSQIQK